MIKWIWPALSGFIVAIVVNFAVDALSQPSEYLAPSSRAAQVIALIENDEVKFKIHPVDPNTIFCPEKDIRVNSSGSVWLSDRFICPESMLTTQGKSDLHHIKQAYKARLNKIIEGRLEVPKKAS